MTICLDTNVLSALFSNEPGAVQLAGQLYTWQQQQPLMIHAAVRAELLAFPGMTSTVLDAELARLGIAVDLTTPSILWDMTGQAFAAYAQRRRASGGGYPRRLMADFFIGAHAQHLGATLCTLDPQHYRMAFPALSLLP